MAIPLYTRPLKDDPNGRILKILGLIFDQFPHNPLRVNIFRGKDRIDINLGDPFGEETDLDSLVELLDIPEVKEELGIISIAKSLNRLNIGLTREEEE